jgi:hypothetical protein
LRKKYGNHDAKRIGTVIDILNYKSYPINKPFETKVCKYIVNYVNNVKMQIESGKLPVTPFIKRELNQRYYFSAFGFKYVSSNLEVLEGYMRVVNSIKLSDIPHYTRAKSRVPLNDLIEVLRQRQNYRDKVACPTEIVRTIMPVICEVSMIKNDRMSSVEAATYSNHQLVDYSIVLNTLNQEYDVSILANMFRLNSLQMREFYKYYLNRDSKLVAIIHKAGAFKRCLNKLVYEPDKMKDYHSYYNYIMGKKFENQKYNNLDTRVRWFKVFCNIYTNDYESTKNNVSRYMYKQVDRREFISRRLKKLSTLSKKQINYMLSDDEIINQDINKEKEMLSAEKAKRESEEADRIKKEKLKEIERLKEIEIEKLKEQMSKKALEEENQRKKMEEDKQKTKLSSIVVEPISITSVVEPKLSSTTQSDTDIDSIIKEHKVHTFDYWTYPLITGKISDKAEKKYKKEMKNDPQYIWAQIYTTDKDYHDYFSEGEKYHKTGLAGFFKSGKKFMVSKGVYIHCDEKIFLMSKGKNITDLLNSVGIGNLVADQSRIGDLLKKKGNSMLQVKDKFIKMEDAVTIVKKGVTTIDEKDKYLKEVEKAMVRRDIEVEEHFNRMVTNPTSLSKPFTICVAGFEYMTKKHIGTVIMELNPNLSVSAKKLYQLKYDNFSTRKYENKMLNSEFESYMKSNPIRFSDISTNKDNMDKYMEQFFIEFSGNKLIEVRNWSVMINK